MKGGSERLHIPKYEEGCDFNPFHNNSHIFSSPPDPFQSHNESKFSFLNS